MRSLKNSFGVIGALVPIAYCIGLLYYFLDLSGSVQEATEDGLGPTMLGLGAVSLILSIPLIMKVVRMIAGTRSPRLAERDGRDSPAREGGVDPDAVLARYLSTRPAEAAATKEGEPPNRPTFGRKIR